MESADEVRASLAVAPLAMLGGARGPLVAELERADRSRASASASPSTGAIPSGSGNFDSHYISDRLFADEAGRQAYAEALARARFPVSPRLSQR